MTRNNKESQLQPQQASESQQPAEASVQAQETQAEAQEQKQAETAEEQAAPELTFREKVIALQNELKAPKSRYNSFGKYSYRSCEDILTAVKPLCAKYGLLLNLTDSVELIGDRFYIKAYASLTEKENIIYEDGTECPMQAVAIGWAREDEIKKGMDGSQITGTASSYARKYALNGLLLIDDTKDADTDEYAKQNGTGGKPTAELELDAYLRQVEEIKTTTELNAWWKSNRPTIPADILNQVYNACKAQSAKLNPNKQ